MAVLKIEGKEYYIEEQITSLELSDLISIVTLASTRSEVFKELDVRVMTNVMLVETLSDYEFENDDIYDRYDEIENNGVLDATIQSIGEDAYKGIVGEIQTSIEIHLNKMGTLNYTIQNLPYTFARFGEQIENFDYTKLEAVLPLIQDLAQKNII